MTHSLTSLLQDWSVHVESCSHLLLRLNYSEALKTRRKSPRLDFFEGKKNPQN